MYSLCKEELLFWPCTPLGLLLSSKHILDFSASSPALGIQLLEQVDPAEERYQLRATESLGVTHDKGVLKIL